MFTKNDLEICRNIINALKRAKLELTGEEILAFVQAFKWLVELSKKIETLSSSSTTTKEEEDDNIKKEESKQVEEKVVKKFLAKRK